MSRVTMPADSATDAGVLCVVCNDRGRTFHVRVVHLGGRYGLEDCLEHDEREPLIEFYDATYADPTGDFGPRGQFVNRYNASTLLGDADPTRGLDLHGGVQVWYLDAAAWHEVRQALSELQLPS